MSPEIVIGIATTAISVLALLVAYISYKSARQTAEEASRLSFQTAKNEVNVEITKQQLDDRRRMQEVLRATEEFREAAEQVEALDIPEVSDQAYEFKVDMLQAYKALESDDLESELRGNSETLEELPAERATAGALRMLEEAKGKVQYMATLSEEQERRVADYVSSIREATEFYGELLAKLTEEDDSAE